MTLNEKIVLALCEILEGGDKHITGYKIAKKIGVQASVVYRQFIKIQGK